MVFGGTGFGALNITYNIMATIDPKILKKTQDLLKPYVKKPPLTDKLLSKPPFRFLHDIITAVINQHGFFEGLYLGDQLQSANVTEKDAKIDFLQKAIRVTEIVSGDKLSTVSPAKIVSGKEPEKTNEWLQSLGKSLKKGLKSSSAVETVLKGGKGKPGKQSSGGSSKREGKPSSAGTGEVPAAPERPAAEPEAPMVEPQPPVAVDTEPPVMGEPEPPAVVVSPEGRQMEELEEPAPRMARPTSAKGPRRKPSADDIAAVTIRQPESEPTRLAGSRPPSSRPGALRARKSADDLGVDQSSALDAQGTAPSGLIIDRNEPDSDDDNFIVQDRPELPDDDIPSMTGGEELDDATDHGGLVRKILETKKELEGSKQPDKPLVNEAHRRKEREMVKREIDKLQTAIQTLCRSANPLGKVIDYLQEDVDSMLKELEDWKAENHETGLALRREQGVTDSQIEPLQQELENLDIEISRQLELISAAKANILRNDERIEKMISSISFSAKA